MRTNLPTSMVHPGARQKPEYSTLYSSPMVPSWIGFPNQTIRERRQPTRADASVGKVGMLLSISILLPFLLADHKSRHVL